MGAAQMERFEIAFRLGRTVYEIEHEMSASEYLGWRAYFKAKDGK